MNNDRFKLNSKWVSVLIPTFNREAYIGECLESIFQQTYPYIKVIIYDDGSEDNTVREIKKFPVHLLEVGKKNKGIPFARNKLMELCETTFAAWQDSDDVSNIYRIEEQVSAIRSSQAPIIYCQYTREKESIKTHWKKKPSASSKAYHSCLGGALFNVEWGRQAPFNEELYSGSDIIWRKKFEKAFGPPVVVQKLLYYYRIHPERITEIKKRPENRERFETNKRIYSRALKRVQ